MTRSIARRVFVLALLALPSACAKDNPAGPTVVTSVTVSPGTDTLIALGRTRQFTAVAKDANGNPVTGVTLVWRSSNPLVATVDSTTGTVTAVGNGLSVIRADAGGVIGQATLAVVQVVAIVVVSPPSAGFTAVGDTQRLAGVAKDSGGAIVQGVRFLWQSSDQAVATVDTGGLLRSKGPGQTFITAAGRGVPGYAVVTVTQTAARLVFVGTPPNVVAGDPFPAAVQVEVRDSNDGLITSARNAITIAVDTGPAGVLTGARTVGAVGGVATFSGIAFEGFAGTHTLKATALGMSSGKSAAFGVAPARAAELLWFDSTGVIGTVGDTQPDMQLALSDRFGNLATTTVDTVRLVVASSHWGSHIRGVTAVAPVNGVATFSGIAFDRPGLGVRVAAQVAGVPSAPSPSSYNDTLPSLTSVSVGSTHLCGVGGGRTFCWGTNSQGELGDGTKTFGDSVPVLVETPLTFTAVTAGDVNSCGLTAAGTAYCWGLAFGNISGDSVPVAVPGGLTFTKLAAGQIHECGLTVAGDVYCWGDNEDGQLGDGLASGLSSLTPVLAAGGHTFTDLSASYYSTCAIATGGVAYCWGLGYYGSLGTGSTASDSVPTLVQGGLQFAQLSMGIAHTCGMTADSLAYCWGFNAQGEVGDSIAGVNSAPVAVLGGHKFTRVAAGGSFTCGIVPNFGTGFLWCWGASGMGLSGAPVNTSIQVDALFAGYSNGCFYIGVQLYCWGTNDDFQIGDGTRTYRTGGYPPVSQAPRKR